MYLYGGNFPQGPMKPKTFLYIFDYTVKFKILMRKIIYYGDGNLRMKDWIWVKASDLRRRIELSNVSDSRVSMRRYSLKSFEDNIFCPSALTNEEPIAVYM